MGEIDSAFVLFNVFVLCIMDVWFAKPEHKIETDATDIVSVLFTHAYYFSSILLF